MRATEEVPFAQWLRQQQQQPEEAPLVNTGASAALDALPPPPRKPTDGNRLCQCCLLVFAALMIPAIIVVAMRPPDPDGERVAETMTFASAASAPVPHTARTSIVMHGYPMPPPLPRFALRWIDALALARWRSCL